MANPKLTITQIIVREGGKDLSVALGVEHDLGRPVPPCSHILCQETSVVVVGILRGVNPSEEYS